MKQIELSDRELIVILAALSVYRREQIGLAGFDEKEVSDLGNKIADKREEK